MARGDKPQYGLIYDLMITYADIYCHRLKKVAQNTEVPWNARTAPFEVDVYFAFLLSCSMLGHKHDRLVWQQVCEYCTEELVARYATHITECEDLVQIITDRIQDYGKTRNTCIEKGMGLTHELLEDLWLNLLASGCRDKVEAKPGVMITDGVKHFEFAGMMEAVEMQVASTFQCCLKHLLQATQDIRTMAIPEMNRLILEGQEDAKRVLGDLPW